MSLFLVEILSEIQGLCYLVLFLQPSDCMFLPTETNGEEDPGLSQGGGEHQVLVPVSMHSADSRGKSSSDIGDGA